MNWAWASSLDQIWRSPTFPMWLTLAAAGFFGIIVLITLLRAEKSVANGVLTVITLLAIAVAVAATIRGFGPDGQVTSAQARPVQPAPPALAALACIDDLAGDAVLNACEKSLFGSAESAAAAVSYAAAQLSRLAAYGDVATAEQNATAELQALRRAVERDRYGLMAYVLIARDHCMPTACPAFRSLADNHQVASNMDERVYENLIARYASSWSAPAAAGVVAALPPTAPTGKPTNAEFPTSASTPAVNIMTPEPSAAAPKPPAAATASAPAAPRPAAAVAATPVPAAAKKPPASKRPAATAQAPVQIAPAPRATPAAPAPAASNDE